MNEWLGREAVERLNAGGVDLCAPVVFDERPCTLVGNTRALWAPFVAWLREAPDRAAGANPLDRYLSGVLAEACACAVSPVERLVLPYERGAPDFVGLSVRSGLLSRGAGGLGVHPVFGPWVALRAVFVHATSAALEPLAESTPCPACPHCDTACGPAFAALARPRDETEFRANWRPWALARAACPTGRAYRYDDDQLRYHYTHDREILRRLARGSEA